MDNVEAVPMPKQLDMVMEENGTADYVRFMKYDMERYAEAVKKLNLQIK